MKWHQPLGVIVGVWNAVEKAGPIQVKDHRVDQRSTVGVLADLFHPSLKGGLIPLLADQSVQIIGKAGDLSRRSDPPERTVGC